MRLRIATRRSRLALAQAEWVAAQLTRSDPAVECEIVEITTTGDTDRTSPVAELSEVGAFVRAVQAAVLDGRADLAVHSCKDLPVAGPPELGVVYPVREEPWDVLCGGTIATLGSGARVGTGSPRRSAQLLALRPDLDVVGIRGNVDTRLGKVGSGEFDAIVLAAAGLRRLGLEDAITHRFSLDEMIPAPGQAALAVEARKDSTVLAVLDAIDHPETRAVVEAERSVLRRTGAGCRSALGVLARRDGSGLSVTGFVDDDAGPRRATVVGADPDAAAGALIDAMGLA